MLGGKGSVGCFAFIDKLIYNVILLFCFLQNFRMYWFIWMQWKWHIFGPLCQCQHTRTSLKVQYWPKQFTSFLRHRGISTVKLSLSCHGMVLFCFPCIERRSHSTWQNSPHNYFTLQMKHLPLSCENHSITSLSSLGYLGVKLPIVACFADILKKP